MPETSTLQTGARISGALGASGTPAWEFSATGTRWLLYHSGATAEREAQAIAAAVALDEARWSPLREHSEIGECNRAAGRWQPVSAGTLELLSACEQWREQSRGVVSPLRARTLPGQTSAGAPPFVGAMELDEAHRLVWLPPGSELDLGGIAKSWIAARATALAARICADPAMLIDAGGDLLAISGEHVIAVGTEEGIDDDNWVRLRAGESVATASAGAGGWPQAATPSGGATATVVACNDALAAVVWARMLVARPEQINRTPYAAILRDGGQTQVSNAWSSVALDAR